MSSAGSREEMLEVLQRAKQAMARHVPATTAAAAATTTIGTELPSNIGILDTYDYDGESAHRSQRPPRPPSDATDNRSHFFDTWCRKIEMFVADPTKMMLELPKELGANDRRELHTLAEKYNLSHHSRGTGATRQLVLKKDALHYRMPDARPDNIETIKQSAGDKQSKFHLRRVRHDPDAEIGSIGTFGDEATANMVHRLERATDEYRKAVEVGYSNEELLALEGGETLEGVLRRAGELHHAADAEGERVNCTLVAPSPTMTSATHEGAADASHCSATLGKPKVSYDEVCLRCRARARVDYDVQKWECNGYCAQCMMQTIWKLIEVEGKTEDLVVSPRSTDRKRSRSETGAVAVDVEVPPLSSAAQQPEEIDKENNEDDTITLEDVVDMASMNDFCAADINWIRRFAGYHQQRGGKGNLSEHIVFCIEFDDLFSMRIFREFLTPAEATVDMYRCKRARDDAKVTTLQEKDHDAFFLYLREVKDPSVPVSVMLEELSACVPDLYNRLAVAFPNLSVYGVAATCVCLIRPGVLDKAGLEAMQKKYGRQNVRFSRELAPLLQEEKDSV